jgi:putative hemolysin
MDTSEKFIDLENVIGKKNPKLLKIIPRFILKYLKRILHQDDLNQILENHKHKQGIEFVKFSLNDLGTSYVSLGTENIPEKGRFIFAANHPLGGLDGLVLINEVGKFFPEVKFIVNDLLLNISNLEPVFVPVNKHGRQSTEYASRIDSAYSSDAQILYFPAGLCSRKIKNTISDLTWHKNFITKAVKYQRDIIPVYVDGKNTSFFYNLANIRKFLGIKVNIEMLYLVDEMFKQRHKKIRIVFGKPISYKFFDNTKSSTEWTAYVRENVYALSGKLNS